MFKVIKKQAGFTLIEMIVSLGVFSIVVTTAVGALLAVIATNQQLQAEQNVMTNLAFALDSMTRELRTGYSYVCGSVSNANQPVIALGPTKMFDPGSTDHDLMSATTTKDCSGGTGGVGGSSFQGISFIEGGNSITKGDSRILYYIDQSDSLAIKIMRRVGNDTPQSILSSGIEIVDAEFFVTGSESLSESSPPGPGPIDTEQPTVTIYIEAKAKNDSTANSYSLQTTVTQRTLDI